MPRKPATEHPHGSLQRYRQGCSCGPCRKANRETRAAEAGRVRARRVAANTGGVVFPDRFNLTLPLDLAAQVRRMSEAQGVPLATTVTGLLTAALDGRPVADTTAVAVMRRHVPTWDAHAILADLAEEGWVLVRSAHPALDVAS